MLRLRSLAAFFSVSLVAGNEYGWTIQSPVLITPKPTREHDILEGLVMTTISLLEAGMPNAYTKDVCRLILRENSTSTKGKKSLARASKECLKYFQILFSELAKELHHLLENNNLVIRKRYHFLASVAELNKNQNTTHLDAVPYGLALLDGIRQLNTLKVDADLLPKMVAIQLESMKRDHANIGELVKRISKQLRNSNMSDIKEDYVREAKAISKEVETSSVEDWEKLLQAAITLEKCFALETKYYEEDHKSHIHFFALGTGNPQIGKGIPHHPGIVHSIENEKQPSDRTRIAPDHSGIEPHPSRMHSIRFIGEPDSVRVEPDRFGIKHSSDTPLRASRKENSNSLLAPDGSVREDEDDASIRADFPNPSSMDGRKMKQLMEKIFRIIPDLNEKSSRDEDLLHETDSIYRRGHESLRSHGDGSEGVDQDGPSHEEGPSDEEDPISERFSRFIPSEGLSSRGLSSDDLSPDGLSLDGPSDGDG